MLPVTVPEARPRWRVVVDSVTGRGLVMLAAGLGTASAALLAVDSGPVGEALAMIQLGVVIGAPPAVLLHDELRSWPVVAVVAVGLSIAMTSLVAQSLIWFDLFGRELLVLLTTGYGVVLAWLLSTAGRGRNPDAAPAGGSGDQ